MAKDIKEKIESDKIKPKRGGGDDGSFGNVDFFAAEFVAFSTNFLVFLIATRFFLSACVG